jgi:hypothetical protein
MHPPAIDTWTFEGTTYENLFAPLFRWREAFQNDFAARMDWCVAPDFKRANHNPIAAIDGDTTRQLVQRTIRSGETVTLSAAGSSDPERNALVYEWFQYREPGTFPGQITIADPGADVITFVAPRVNTPQTVHVVLSVRDNGEPALYSYKRVVLTVVPSAAN